MLLALNRWIKGASCREPARRGARANLTILQLEEKVTPSIVGAIGSGPGIPNSVSVYDETGAIIHTFQPYAAAFTGGVNVAVGDVTGEGVLDVVTGAGPSGGPHVEVFDGAALLNGIDRPLISFFPYAQAFTGGVYVAAGDIDSNFGGDHRAEIVTGPGFGGGPDTRAFAFDSNGTNMRQILQFAAYDQSFTGGVRVALADFGGDNGGVPGSKTMGDDEIVTAPGPGGGPHIRMWDYDAQEFDPDNFMNLIAGFGAGFTGGFYVSGGYLTNNKDEDGFVYADLVVTADAGGGPHLLTYRLDGFVDPARRNDAVYILANSPIGINEDTGLPEDVVPNNFLFSKFMYNANFHGGVRVAVIHDINLDGFDDLVIGPGPGNDPSTGSPPNVQIINGIDGQLLIDMGQPITGNTNGVSVSGG
jgi:hypothetical protein